MKIIRVSYCALAAFAFAASCAKEAAEPNVIDWNDGSIYFRPTVYNVAGSRAQDMTLNRLESFQVTCFNTADRDKDKQGHILPYFENATFVQQKNYTYVSSPDEGPRDWPPNEGPYRFFAFSPSLEAMAADTLINSSTEINSGISIGYRLEKVNVKSDISKQFDFVTAEVSGTKRDFTGGVELAFAHCLCQVELRAWGDGSTHDFEIAGLRIGNPVVEATYVFADEVGSPESGARWELDGDGVKDKVEYYYGGTENADTIFRINGEEHNTAELAASLMGQGGCAMVVPTINKRWEGLKDPNITVKPYKTERMYFSILTRVTDSATGAVVYPYPGNPYGMKVESYAVDSSGTIVRRVYAGATEGEYFTDYGRQQPYSLEDGIEIKDFGWAAVPVDADWKAGKRYVYTLDYSEGIGLHDPEDPEPGKPIGGDSSIKWGVGVETWEYAAKDENFDPDLEVPFE